MTHKFKTDKFDYIINKDGCWLSFLAKDKKQADMFLNSIKDKDYFVEIKEHRKRRSLDANAYCWVLCDRIAKILKGGNTKEDIYRDAIRKAGVFEIVPVLVDKADDFSARFSSKGEGWFVEEKPSKLRGCKNLVIYFGSSTYNTKEMADLIDYIVSECEELGITTEPPEEIERMKSLWQSQ